jgi:hypothetical protein
MASTTQDLQLLFKAGGRHGELPVIERVVGDPVIPKNQRPRLRRPDAVDDGP